MATARDTVDTPSVTDGRGVAVGEVRPTPWDAVSRFSLRNLLLAVIAALIAGGVAGAFVATGQPTFRAQATLLIDQSQALATQNDPGVVNKLNLLRLKYATLSVTPLITKPVAQRLGITPGEVARSLRPTVVSQSLVLALGAESPGRQRAPQIAQASAEQLVRYAAGEQSAAKVPADRRITLTIVAPAAGSAKISPTRGKAVAAAAGIGAVVLAAVYALVQLVSAPRRWLA